MADVQYTSSRALLVKQVDNRLLRAAEIIGGMAEGYAKELCPVDTGNLRNSITHKVVNDGQSVSIMIGTNVEYGPYVELGTGVEAEDGKGRQTPWSYKDRKGKWHRTSGRKPKPFLRPAIENHIDQYRHVIEEETR